MSTPAPPDSAPTDRPLGISLLIWLFWFWTGAVVLALLGFAIGDGPIMMSGRAVPRDEALGSILPALVPMGLAAAGAALALGLDRPWARPAVLLPFVLAGFGPLLGGLASATLGDLALSVLVTAPLVGVVAWYLYGLPGTRSYFEALGRASEEAGRP